MSMDSHYAVEPCDAHEAADLWQRCLHGLADPVQNFGPDVEVDHARAEQFYRLYVGDRVIGLGWVRRFTRLGHIRSFGKALLPDARGRGFSRASSIILVKRIFADFPDCCTLLAMIWSTNPSYRRIPGPDRHPNVRTVGEILEALPTGESLHIIQILRPEEIGAPHAHHDAMERATTR
jgi:hypothetical protein